MSDLGAIFDRQRRLQVSSYGGDPENFKPDEKAEYIRWNVLALEDELHEALAEVGWKPWAKSRHVNREAFKGEMVDALHFFVNLCLATGVSAEEIVEGYFAKATKNAARQSEGYDGVTGKCPICKRALDDSAVTCGQTMGEWVCMDKIDELGRSLNDKVEVSLGIAGDPGKVEVHDHYVKPNNGFKEEPDENRLADQWIDVTWGNPIRPTWRNALNPDIYSYDGGITRFRLRPGESLDDPS